MDAEEAGTTSDAFRLGYGGMSSGLMLGPGFVCTGLRVSYTELGGCVHFTSKVYSAIDRLDSK